MSGARIPSGEQVVLRHGDDRAVVTESGATLRALRLGGHDVLHGFAENEVCARGRGQLLIPWPNRVRGGRFTWNQVEHQLDLSEPALGNAIHGLVRWVSWRVEEAGESMATLTYDLLASHPFPFSLILRVTYRLDDGGLRVTMAAENSGDAEAPYGAGAHPYLRAGAHLIDEWRLTMPAARQLITDASMIPVGTQEIAEPFESSPIGDTVLDTCFTNLRRASDGNACTTLHGEWGDVTLWQDAALPYLMLFSGDGFPSHERRRSLAIEPMTCAPDAFNSGAGLVRLAPGETHEASWGIRLER